MYIERKQTVGSRINRHSTVVAHMKVPVSCIHPALALQWLMQPMKNVESRGSDRKLLRSCSSDGFLIDRQVIGSLSGSFKAAFMGLKHSWLFYMIVIIDYTIKTKQAVFRAGVSYGRFKMRVYIYSRVCENDREIRFSAPFIRNIELESHRFPSPLCMENLIKCALHCGTFHSFCLCREWLESLWEFHQTRAGSTTRMWQGIKDCLFFQSKVSAKALAIHNIH